MEGNPGLRISKKAFTASFLVLLSLMIFAGILTIFLPSGSYDRTQGPNRDQLVSGSYRSVEKSVYPVWRWLTAPAEVLGSADGLQAAVIIVFIMIVGGSFAVLDKASVLGEVVYRLAERFASRRYLLLALVSFFFMAIGSFLGIFEETIPLVPIAIALAAAMGWDRLTGLGMSILATGFGFSAAVANPFTIGTAQRLSGLPLFSGAGFRVGVFILVYALFFLWLRRRARRCDEAKSAAVDARAALKRASADPGLRPGRGAAFFSVSVSILVAAVIAISATRILADYSMPLIAAAFLVAGLGSGAAAGLGARRLAKAFLAGVLGILPGIILILMAMSIKHIIVSGGVIDTILYGASRSIEGMSGYGAAMLMYLLSLAMNFFIGSATAKAFLLMPILAPLADLGGLSRQIAVQAFAFGDGFSNMLYPTNAVLLIALGVAGMAWTEWFRRTWFLQACTLLLTMALLLAGVAIGYK